MEATRVGTELTGGPGVLAVSHGPTEAGSVVTKANACIIQASLDGRLIRYALTLVRGDSLARGGASLPQRTGHNGLATRGIPGERT